MPSTRCRRYPAKLSKKRVRASPFRTFKKVKKAERNYKGGKSIGFTKKASLKSMGRLARSDGCYYLGPKYKTMKRTRSASRKFW